jgi:hypothetical protein
MPATKLLKIILARIMHASMRCLHVRRSDACRRSVWGDQCEATRDAARLGLIRRVGGSSGHTARRFMPSATHRNTACGIAARTPCISQKDEPHLIGGRTVTRHAIRPASKTSAFDNIRAFSSRRAGSFPSEPASQAAGALRRSTSQYISLPKSLSQPSLPIVAMEANHQILSNWLKRTTRCEFASGIEWSNAQCTTPLVDARRPRQTPMRLQS